MEAIITKLQEANVNPDVFLKASAILALGSLLLGCIGRFIFGKKSAFFHAVSSSIGIIFVYGVAIVVYSAFPDFTKFIPKIPFVSFSDTSMQLFVFQNAHYTVLCSQLLDMVILAFLANLLESCIPAGKNIFLWLLSKCVTVLGAILLQLLVNWLIAKYIPQGLITYAPTILLGLLVLLLLVGALKFLVGAILASVHPIIGAFYTFFFATLVGKSITKALLTTGILTGIVYALNYVGLYNISIATAALIAYLPLVIVLAFIWYIINRISK